MFSFLVRFDICGSEYMLAHFDAYLCPVSAPLNACQSLLTVGTIKLLFN